MIANSYNVVNELITALIAEGIPAAPATRAALRLFEHHDIGADLEALAMHRAESAAGDELKEGDEVQPLAHHIEWALGKACVKGEPTWRFQVARFIALSLLEFVDRESAAGTFRFGNYKELAPTLDSSVSNLKSNVSRLRERLQGNVPRQKTPRLDAFRAALLEAGVYETRTRIAEALSLTSRSDFAIALQKQ